MRTKLFTLVVLVSLMGLTTLQAQGINFGVGAGVNIFTGDVAKSIEDGGTGFAAEPAFGIKAKFGLPMLPLKIVGKLNYTMMGSSADFQGASVEVESSLLTVAAGVEFGLIPGPLTPYLAADLLYSSFGETTVKVTGLPDDKTEGESRFGLGIGAGLEFSLLPKINLDINLMYNFNNMMGKDDGEEDANTVLIMANVIF